MYLQGLRHYSIQSVFMLMNLSQDVPEDGFSPMGRRALHFLEGEFWTPRQSPLFTLNYLAINDETNGQYCQIGVLKYIF